MVEAVERKAQALRQVQVAVLGNGTQEVGGKVTGLQYKPCDCNAEDCPACRPSCVSPTECCVCGSTVKQHETIECSVCGNSACTETCSEDGKCNTCVQTLKENA